MKLYFSNSTARCAIFCCLVLAACRLQCATASLRPGAPRTLRIEGKAPGEASWRSDDEASLAAMSLTQPVFAPRANRRETDGLPFIFTRRAAGTRNLWRAVVPANVIAPQEKSGATLNAQPAARRGNELLQATPLTDFIAPFWADSAAPTPDGNLVFVTNVNADSAGIAASRSAIALFDARSRRVSALTPSDARNVSPAVSPDGAYCAYVSDRGGFDSIYLLPLRSRNSQRADVKRLVSLARDPFWLDAQTLVYQSARPGDNGLYRVSLDDTPLQPQLLWSRGGKGAASDGRTLCVAASNRAHETQLYTLAADGSGARVIGGSDGADNAAIAPGSAAILFDAPTGDAAAIGKSTPEFGRTLWMVPMLHVQPTAILSEVRARAAGAGLEIWGTIFSQGNAAPRVRLAWSDAPEAQATNDGSGEDGEAKLWNEIPVERATVNIARLATWTPPAARGNWILRLWVSDENGDIAHSDLQVSLPLEEDAPPPVAPIFSTLPRDLAPGANPASNRSRSGAPNSMPISPAPNPRVALGPIPALPLPALPPPPTATPVAPPAPTLPVRRTETKPAPRPKPYRKPQEKPKPAPRPSQRLRGDAAVVTISGVPVAMTVGEEAPLIATLRNVGSNGWKVGGDAPVRLLIRWHDGATGNRSRWAVRWLRADVPPGGLTKIPFALAAPLRAGRYTLKFSLVRAGKNGYEAPAFDSPTMPGEFGIASTTMDVKAK